jgi:hypothetical protein
MQGDHDHDQERKKENRFIDFSIWLGEFIRWHIFGLDFLFLLLHR